MSNDRKSWTEFVARYYGDQEFAKTVDADPTAALRKAGFSLPAGKKAQLVKNTSETVHFVLPDSSATGLDTEELQDIYAGCSTASGTDSGYSI